MKANNLSISIPNYGCDKNCPYCVSKMTGYIKKDNKNFYRNLKKVVSFAKTASVTSVSFTSKGEILFSKNSIDALIELAGEYFKHFPLEIQTNATFLTPEIVETLYICGINTIAMSIDDYNQISKLKEIFEEINNFGMTTRLTVNLVPNTYEDLTPKDYFLACRHYEIQQLSFRNITVPNQRIADTKIAKETVEWINENIDKGVVNNFIEKLNTYVHAEGFFIRQLPFGAQLYNVNGIDTTYFDYCIQDGVGNEEIRSLVYYEDGHLTTGWYGSNVGRIF